MFLESLWNKFSFDLLPTLPIKVSFGALFLLFAFSMFPSYIAYARQSLQRKRIYTFSVIDFAIFYFCFFFSVESSYFNRGDLTIFAKTLYAILLLGAMIDLEDKKSYPYRKKTFFKKYISHPFESFVSHLFYLIFKLLPVEWASWLGGKIGVLIGKTQKRYNKLMDANLKIAFPRKSFEEKEKIKHDVWEMMGKYTAEPVHFPTIYRNYEKYLTFENDKILDRLKDKPYVAFISHSGTMGLIAIPFALHKAPCSILYKYPSNNLTNKLVTKSFGNGIGTLKFVPNTANGTRDAMKILMNGSAMLAVPDQKFRTGIPTKFFGAKVKSPVGVAKLASHFNCPILPIQIVREHGLHHKIIFHDIFMPFKSKDKDADAIKTTQKINDIIEGWIKENPSQWFWVHDRWDIKDKLKEKNDKSKNNKK
ncbi:MAG: hypothetical protein IJ638_00860 [Alphaproteobacteria bacterium]|nr:hypothetical protein [Alphaproteobacteria bacterium]